MLFSVFDKPARSLFLNINMANGYSSCVKCQQTGEYINYGNGRHIVFRYDNINIDQPLRTIENYKSDLENKING